MVLAWLAMFATGCAGLQGEGEGLQANAVEDSAQVAEVVPPPQEAVAFSAQPYGPADFASSGEAAYVSHDLAIEYQVARASAAAIQRELEAEARAVAAIKASLEETRRRNDAWLRLRNGMQLTPVDNARVRAQL